ncbi:hypothetical protein BS47DRAFT_175630 [Hydnum rufescens UP504]|uniref:Uncharacterized protein n=1 Tax=Hydnum rufescens UP504 TaxID=1448309 RepID=A0A9P6ANZ5_9AGAM|nr:hypothetical protein BS47DRAFT_175630 [Hydnum rufescens UP504]
MLIQCPTCSDNFYKRRLNVIRPLTFQENYAARFLFPLDFQATEDVQYYWKPSLDKLIRELVEAHGESTTHWPKLHPSCPRPVELRKEYVSVLQGAKYYREWRKAVQTARKHAVTFSANRLRKWSQKKNLKYIALRESAPQAMRALDYSMERMEVLDGAAWSIFRERIEQEVLSNTPSRPSPCCC